MVLYFSGTGNSRYLARCIAEGLGKTELTGAERIWFVMDCGSEIGNAAGRVQESGKQMKFLYLHGLGQKPDS